MQFSARQTITDYPFTHDKYTSGRAKKKRRFIPERDTFLKMCIPFPQNRISRLFSTIFLYSHYFSKQTIFVPTIFFSYNSYDGYEDLISELRQQNHKRYRIAKPMGVNPLHISACT